MLKLKHYRQYHNLTLTYSLLNRYNNIFSILGSRYYMYLGQSSKIQRLKQGYVTNMNKDHNKTLYFLLISFLLFLNTAKICTKILCKSDRHTHDHEYKIKRLLYAKQSLVRTASDQKKNFFVKMLSTNFLTKIGEIWHSGPEYFKKSRPKKT